MKKGGPARPGHDPTMETAMGVIACVIVGLLFVTAKPQLNAQGIPYSGAAVMLAHFPPPASRLHGGKLPHGARHGASTVEMAPPVASSETAAPAATESGSPSLDRLAHRDLYQLNVPAALAQTAGDAEPVKSLVEATVHVATAANVLIGSRYTRQFREAHEVMGAESDRLDGLKFTNPKWKGVYKKALAAVKHVKGATDLMYRVRESDDYSDSEAEALETHGRHELKVGMEKLQRVINYMEILRKKGFMSKA